MTRKLSALLTSTALTLILALATASPVDAGWFRHHRRACRPAAVPARCGAFASYPVSPALSAAPTPQTASQDAGGFVAWVNGVRARHGLRAVAWDAGLAADAAANSARGFGHSYLGRARRQNAGVGSLGTVEAMWLQSPAHAAAILDPSLTYVGLASVGGVWTMNGR